VPRSTVRARQASATRQARTSQAGPSPRRARQGSARRTAAAPLATQSLRRARQASHQATADARPARQWPRPALQASVKRTRGGACLSLRRHPAHRSSGRADGSARRRASVMQVIDARAPASRGLNPVSPTSNRSAFHGNPSVSLCVTRWESYRAPNDEEHGRLSAGELRRRRRWVECTAGMRSIRRLQVAGRSRFRSPHANANPVPGHWRARAGTSGRVPGTNRDEVHLSFSNGPIPADLSFSDGQIRARLRKRPCSKRSRRSPATHCTRSPPPPSRGATIGRVGEDAVSREVGAPLGPVAQHVEAAWLERPSRFDRRLLARS
jgi:hypothetical protein